MINNRKIVLFMT